MSLKFCANLNFLFPEAEFISKYRLAKNAGFKAVEGGYPVKGTSIEDVIKAKNESGLEHILMNISNDGTQEMQFGCASFPHGIEQFRKNLTNTINLAKAINCKKIHIMAGKTSKPITETNKEYYDTYVSNLKHAANLFEKEDILGVIEPINKYALPGYYLNSYEAAVEVIKEVKSNNIKLMLDFYHLQHICGNITNTFKNLAEYIGHIQIAQVPHRFEPNIPGEIDYRYVLDLIAKSSYKGWIGLEYRPIQDTVSGLKWIQQYKYNL